MVIKHLENKIRLVGIICTVFLVGCIIISVSSIWTARTMVTDAQKKVYVLDGNVPILVTRTTMDETLDVEAKSHVEMFHHYFFKLRNAISPTVRLTILELFISRSLSFVKANKIVSSVSSNLSYPLQFLDKNSKAYT